MDVGMENVVVVGKKADESRVLWERFEVGSCATQTRVSCGDSSVFMIVICIAKLVSW